MKIIYCRWPFRIASLFMGGFPPYAISMIPLIILVNKDVHVSSRQHDDIIYHEKVHQWQMLFTLYIGFYVSYILFYLFNLLIYFGDGHRAYQQIPWEIQARRKTRERDGR